MRRREFIAGLGGAAATWPVAARAQQGTMPIIGFLYPAGRDTSGDVVAAFNEGLAAAGYHSGKNVTIEYRWGDRQADRLPGLVAELVAKKVSLIVANSAVAALATKAATSTIPIVFLTSDDPVRLGLVASVNRPGANLTGVNFLGNEVGTKRLDLLRELAPTAKRLGLLLNPGSPPSAGALPLMRSAAEKLGYHVDVQHLQSERDVQSAFAALTAWKADAAIVLTDQLVRSLRAPLAQHASRHGIPTIYPVRDFVVSGGLVSYGSDLSEAYRQVGNYTARILKGERPAELPVVQSAKFELVVNLKAAKAIGLVVPEAFLIRADEVIE